MAHCTVAAKTGNSAARSGREKHRPGKHDMCTTGEERTWRAWCTVHRVQYTAMCTEHPHFVSARLCFLPMGPPGPPILGRAVPSRQSSDERSCFLPAPPARDGDGLHRALGMETLHRGRHPVSLPVTTRHVSDASDASRNLQSEWTWATALGRILGSGSDRRVSQCASALIGWAAFPFRRRLTRCLAVPGTTGMRKVSPTYLQRARAGCKERAAAPFFDKNSDDPAPLTLA